MPVGLFKSQRLVENCPLLSTTFSGQKMVIYSAVKSGGFFFCSIWLLLFLTWEPCVAQ